MKGEKITFDEFKEEEPIDRHVKDEFKERYNEFLNGLLPTVLLEEGVKGDTNTVKLPKEKWQEICETILAWFLQMPYGKNLKIFTGARESQAKS